MAAEKSPVARCVECFLDKRTVQQLGLHALTEDCETPSIVDKGRRTSDGSIGFVVVTCPKYLGAERAVAFDVANDPALTEIEVGTDLTLINPRLVSPK